MLSEEHCAPSFEIQRPPTLPINMDATELGELFASCMPRLAKTAKQIMRNSPDSEDVLQEGLLSAFQNLNQFQGRSKFSTWLHSIIRNAAKMHMRKMASRPLYSIERELADQNSFLAESAFPDTRPNPEESCAQEERSRILMTTLGDLPPIYQRVIQLCDIEGLGGRDAAETLGLSIPALKTCLHRARRSVSRRISQSRLPLDRTRTRQLDLRRSRIAPRRQRNLQREGSWTHPGVRRKTGVVEVSRECGKGKSESGAVSCLSPDDTSRKATHNTYIASRYIAPACFLRGWDGLQMP